MIVDITPITEPWRQWTFLRAEEEVIIEHEGILYPSLRHALEATKTPDLKERESLIQKHPIAVATWGIDKPTDPAYKAEWSSKVQDITLVLAAQKYGLIETAHDFRKRLKLGMWLILTTGKPIIYSNTQCDTWWGRCFCDSHGKVKHNAQGFNILGTSTQTIRSKIIREMEGSDPLVENTCDWCREYRRNRTTPAESYILYLKNGDLVRRAMCDRHLIAEKQEAKRYADTEWHIYRIGDYPPDFRLPSLIEPNQNIKIINHPHHRTSHFIPSPAPSPPPPPVKDTWGSLFLTEKSVKSYVIGTLGG